MHRTIIASGHRVGFDIVLVLDQCYGFGTKIVLFIIDGGSSSPCGFI
jgi:hypothetical protein